LQKFLNEKNIPTAIHYPVPLHLQPAFEYLELKKGLYPVSEKMSETVLSLPLYPGMTEEQQDYIIKNIAGFY